MGLGKGLQSEWGMYELGWQEKRVERRGRRKGER